MTQTKRAQPESSKGERRFWPMVRGKDWHFVALIHVITALFVIAAFWNVSNYNALRGQQRDLKIQSPIAADQTYQCSGLVAATDKIECLLNVIRAQEDDRRDQADLLAQQDMATWALALLWASAIGLVINVMGIVVVYFSLLETRTLTIATREIGEAQIRPFLMVTGGKVWARVSNGNCSLIVNLEIENAGATPTLGAILTVQLFPKMPDGLSIYQDAGRIGFWAKSQIAPLAPKGSFSFNERTQRTVSEIVSALISVTQQPNPAAEIEFVVWVTLSWTDYAGRISEPQKISMQTRAKFLLTSETSAEMALDYPRIRT